MERRNAGYLIAIVALAVAVIGMSIGFAFSDIELKIDGEVTTKAQSWDVHFDPESIEPNASSVAATNSISTNVVSQYLTATYSVTLEKVGDFYEFTINAKNFGNFNAKLSSIAISDGTEYLAHTVKYNGTTITAGTVSDGAVLAPGESDVYTVRVQYIEPTDAEDLPSSDVTATYSVTLTYTQVSA